MADVERNGVDAEADFVNLLRDNHIRKIAKFVSSEQWAELLIGDAGVTTTKAKLR